jgi:hypothetical protein
VRTRAVCGIPVCCESGITLLCASEDQRPRYNCDCHRDAVTLQVLGKYAKRERKEDD